MGDFRPIANDHAIAEAAFAIHFKDQLPATVMHLASERLKSTLDADFPHPRPAFNIQFSVDALRGLRLEGSQSGPLSLQDKPQDPGRTILFTPSYFSVNYLKYTRWHEVWPSARKTLQESLECISAACLSADSNLNITHIGVQYVDKFIADLPVSPLALPLLFEERSSYLSSRIFTGSIFWHIHQGWIETLDNSHVGTNCLTVLNITSYPEGQRPLSPESIDEAAQLAIAVDNLIRADNVLSYEDLFRKDDGAALDAVVEELHDRNKGILRDLITDDMCKKIGLGAKK
ncbi:MAG TPA: TIGR04255 family protein [Aliidongia sp.]|nr:TIGR04255 family protein [Aliidongia sp.]